MCVPAKGLQMTIKAFIKTERKKRGAETAVAAVEPVASPPEEKSTPAIAPPADLKNAAVAGGEEENATMSGPDQEVAAEAAVGPVIEVSQISTHSPQHI